MNSEFKPYLVGQSIESEFRDIVARRRQRRLSVWSKQAATALLNFLTGQQTISIRKDLNNQPPQPLRWIVYDPQTDVRKVFDSERSLQAWLEQRHL